MSYSGIENSARHLLAVEFCGDVVPNSRDAHSNSSNTPPDTENEDPAWPLENDDTYETETADRGNSLDAYPEDGPPHASSMTEHTILNQYHCEKLKEDHLRLVRVLPGPKDEIVHCKTRIVPLSDQTKYIAVSYAWGAPIAEHAIVLDGRRHMLPNNLWQFLVTWRSRLGDKGNVGNDSDEYNDGIFNPKYQSWVSGLPKLYPITPDQMLKVGFDQRKRDAQLPLDLSSDWLWVDALCIDQMDLQERMHQVRIMPHIFRGAEEVLVWLGPTNYKVDDLMDWFISQRVGFYGFSTRLSQLSGIRDLCERSYWSRLWIFQELRSAKEITIMCGSHTFSWSEFERALFKSSKHVKLSAAQRMMHLCSGTPTSLWLLLQVTSHLECHDRRDKVYSLLSMAKTGSEGIDADYAMSLPQLMNLVLMNLHSSNPPGTVHQIAIQCSRLKSLMGLEPDFPWCADDYLAAADSDFIAAVQGSV